MIYLEKMNSYEMILAKGKIVTDFGQAWIYLLTEIFKVEKCIFFKNHQILAVAPNLMFVHFYLLLWLIFLNHKRNFLIWYIHGVFNFSSSWNME